MKFFIFLLICYEVSSKVWLAHAFNGNNSFGKPDESVREEDDTPDDSTVWKKFQSKAREFVNNLIRQSLPIMITVNSDAKVTRECSTAFYQMTFGLQNMKSWAMRMLDSSGRPPAGILDGSLVDYGDFDECLNVVAKDERRDNGEKFRGHYCRVDMHPLLPKKVPRLTHHTPVLDFSNFTRKDSVLRDIGNNGPMFYLLWFQFGLCVPSVCTREDIQEVMDVALRGMPLIPKVMYCQKKEPTELSTVQLIIIGIFSAFGLIIFVCTLFDVVQRRRKKEEQKDQVESSKLRDCVIAFSLYTNIEKLMSTDAGSDNLSAINGLRCLTMTWIVLVHSYGFTNRYALARLQEMKNSLENIAFQIITNSWLSVDTFFLIGGVVVTYSTLKSLDKTNGKLNFFRHVVRRYWRLIPPIAAALGFVFLLPLFGSGPAWPEEVGGVVERCQRNWWGPLFGVNTWIAKRDMCMFHTWYVSADIHYYIAAPLILIPLYKWRTFGLFLILAFTLTSAVVIAVLTALNDYYPTILYLLPDEEFTIKMFDVIYARPYTHVGSYCAGIFVGYLILRHKEIKIKPIYQLLGWLAAITCNFAILFGTYDWSRGYLPSTSISAIYAALHRTGWALTIGWLIYMCATGHGGILNRLLSWKAFIPLSRLCYCTYIVHFLALYVRNGFRRQKFFFSHYDFVYEFFGNLTISVLVAFIGYLMFEAPFSVLDSIIFPKPKTNYPKVIEMPKVGHMTAFKRRSPEQNGINGINGSVFGTIHYNADSTCL